MNIKENPIHKKIGKLLFCITKIYFRCIQPNPLIISEINNNQQSEITNGIVSVKLGNCFNTPFFFIFNIIILVTKEGKDLVKHKNMLQSLDGQLIRPLDSCHKACFCLKVYFFFIIFIYFFY